MFFVCLITLSLFKINTQFFNIDDAKLKSLFEDEKKDDEEEQEKEEETEDEDEEEEEKTEAKPKKRVKCRCKKLSDFLKKCCRKTDKFFELIMNQQKAERKKLKRSILKSLAKSSRLEQKPYSEEKPRIEPTIQEKPFMSYHDESAYRKLLTKMLDYQDTILKLEESLLAKRDATISKKLNLIRSPPRPRVFNPYNAIDMFKTKNSHNEILMAKQILDEVERILDGKDFVPGLSMRQYDRLGNPIKASRQDVENVIQHFHNPKTAKQEVLVAKRILDEVERDLLNSKLNNPSQNQPFNFPQFYAPNYENGPMSDHSHEWNMPNFGYQPHWPNPNFGQRY